jgi:hypothetical protein
LAPQPDDARSYTVTIHRKVTPTLPMSATDFESSWAFFRNDGNAAGFPTLIKAEVTTTNRA